MRLFLLRCWPALIPLLIYWLWVRVVARKAVMEGKNVPRFRDGPWYWAILVSLLVAILCLGSFGASMEAQKGHYVPSHLEGDKIVPGDIHP